MDKYIKALVCKSKNPLVPEGQNLYGRLVDEWDFNYYIIRRK